MSHTDAMNPAGAPESITVPLNNPALREHPETALVVANNAVDLRVRQSVLRGVGSKGAAVRVRLMAVTRTERWQPLSRP